MRAFSFRHKRPSPGMCYNMYYMGLLSAKLPAIPPSNLNRDSFEKLLAGNKNYVPGEVKDALKKAGLQGYLTKPHVTKREALRALKVLREAGQSPRPIADTQNFREVALRQQRIENTKIQEKKSRKVRAGIRADLAEEGEELAKQHGSLVGEQYDPTSRVRHGEVVRIEQERAKRQSQATQEKQRRDELHAPKGIDPKKPKLTDDLPDMGIDFGD